MVVKAVIFDMDGVLTDSEWFIAEAGRLMFLEKHGTRVTHEDFLPFVGMGENRFLGGVAEKYAVGDFDIDRDKKRTYEIYVDIIKGKLKPLPGAIEFVRGCRDRGFRTALATSTDYIKMKANLEAIGLCGPVRESCPGTEAGFAGESPSESAFDALVNGLDVERRKPFPDIFLLAADRMGVEPACCWVIEDSMGGIAAAKAAGMRCLALLTTFPEAEIRASGAELVAKDLSAVSPDALFS
jgi:beta-phosphoglucomutase-like phosphatase (HAD superfamily)